MDQSIGFVLSCEVLSILTEHVVRCKRRRKTRAALRSGKGSCIGLEGIVRAIFRDYRDGERSSNEDVGRSEKEYYRHVAFLIDGD